MLPECHRGGPSPPRTVDDIMKIPEAFRASLLVLLARAERGSFIRDDEVKVYLTEEQYARYRALGRRHAKRLEAKYYEALSSFTGPDPSDAWVQRLATSKKTYKTQMSRLRFFSNKITSTQALIKSIEETASMVTEDACTQTPADTEKARKARMARLRRLNAKINSSRTMVETIEKSTGVAKEDAWRAYESLPDDIKIWLNEETAIDGWPPSQPLSHKPIGAVLPGEKPPRALAVAQVIKEMLAQDEQ